MAIQLSVPQDNVPSPETERTLNSKWRFKLSVQQNTVPSAEIERPQNSK
jgi:hypothetical protein